MVSTERGTGPAAGHVNRLWCLLIFRLAAATALYRCVQLLKIHARNRTLCLLTLPICSLPIKAFGSVVTLPVSEDTPTGNYVKPLNQILEIEPYTEIL
jgi:hypothetical protein